MQLVKIITISHKLEIQWFKSLDFRIFVTYIGLEGIGEPFKEPFCPKITKNKTVLFFAKLFTSDFGRPYLFIQIQKKSNSWAYFTYLFKIYSFLDDVRSIGELYYAVPKGSGSKDLTKHVLNEFDLDLWLCIIRYRFRTSLLWLFYSLYLMISCYVNIWLCFQLVFHLLRYIIQIILCWIYKSYLLITCLKIELCSKTSILFIVYPNCTIL